MYTDENKHFYEFEPAVVLDVILDENHPIFKTRNVIMDNTSVPDKFDGTPVLENSIDYSWIGRILVRPLVSAYKINKDDIVDYIKHIWKKMLNDSEFYNSLRLEGDPKNWSLGIFREY